jgi:hypothetical protein
MYHIGPKSAEEQRNPGSPHLGCSPSDGPDPNNLLDVPGCVLEVMDQTLETAPYSTLALGSGGAPVS